MCCMPRIPFVVLVWLCLFALGMAIGAEMPAFTQWAKNVAATIAAIVSPVLRLAARGILLQLQDAWAAIQDDIALNTDA